MTISSRTPEGSPQQCPLCGKVDYLEPCDPGGDFICPSCGHLFWQIRDHFTRHGMAIDRISLRTNFSELDSLDIVELIMELEEELEVTIPDEMAEEIRTVEDAIRYLIRLREEQA